MKNNKSTKFCIVVPAYNAQETILDTLEGIEVASRNLEFKPTVFVVDDKSTDETAERVRQFRSLLIDIELISNDKNMGERGSLNAICPSLCLKYDWFFLIHADDIPYPMWLVRILELIDVHEDVNLFSVWSSYDNWYFHKNKIIIGDVSGVVKFKDYNSRLVEEANELILRTSSSFHISGCAINIRCLMSVGGFDPYLAQFGDTDFYVRSILKGYYDIYLGDSLTKYRILDSSVTAVSFQTNRDLKEIIYLIDKFKNELYLWVIIKLKIKVFKLCMLRLITACIKLDFSKSANQIQFLYLFFFTSLLKRDKKS